MYKIIASGAFGIGGQTTLLGAGAYRGLPGHGGGGFCGGGGGGFYSSGLADQLSFPGGQGFQQGGAGASLPLSFSTIYAYFFAIFSVYISHMYLFFSYNLDLIF
jgi:hypothetical protein